MSRHAAFWLLFLLGLIGGAVVQSSFNNVLNSVTQVKATPAVA